MTEPCSQVGAISKLEADYNNMINILEDIKKTLNNIEVKLDANFKEVEKKYRELEIKYVELKKDVEVLTTFMNSSKDYGKSMVKKAISWGLGAVLLAGSAIIVTLKMANVL